MKKFFKSDRGMTLVEIMVVLVIIAIGIIPIALVQTNSSRDVIKSGQRTQALAIAQNQMERMKNLGFSAAAPDSGAVGLYTWRASVTNEAIGLNRVVVTVSWSEVGTQRTLQIDNLLSTR
jgi:prepilin-type N-terminal cleavage/methylation domain-containing protein